MTAGRTQMLAKNSVRNWCAVVGQILRSLVVLMDECKTKGITPMVQDVVKCNVTALAQNSSSKL